MLLASKHKIFQKHECEVELVPQPSGTGQMITSYKEGKIDLAIGLTEGWINGLAATPNLYKLVGTYVSSPLCWAISAGAAASLTSAQELRGKKIGVSRIGSGSYVMSFVFADQQGWLGGSAAKPFEFVKLDTFKGLRDGVNGGTADAFMWERFTTKKYYDSGEIKNIGHIDTPWPSWLITASPKLSTDRVSRVLAAINKGVEHYRGNFDESMKVIYTTLDYSQADAEEWSKTVRFADNVKGVDEKMVQGTIDTLRKAGLMTENENIVAQDMILTI